MPHQRTNTEFVAPDGDKFVKLREMD
eukprot:COSAG06_NODE_54557_length_294_cov_0.553846_1_plen_25_part_01